MKKRKRHGLCSSCKHRKHLKNHAVVCKALDEFLSDLHNADVIKHDWIGWDEIAVCNSYEKGKTLY